MKTILTATATILAFAVPALAEGDAEAGEKAFKKCKACHAIQSDDGEDIVKGGKTGPNLYGVIGRVAGSVEGFKYGDGLTDAMAAEFGTKPNDLVPYVDEAFYLDKTEQARILSFVQRIANVVAHIATERNTLMGKLESIAKLAS